VFKTSTLGAKSGLAELHFDPMRGYSIVTEKPVLAVLVGLDDPRGRIHRLDDLTSALSAREGRIQYILADEPGRVVVKYKSGA